MTLPRRQRRLLEPIGDQTTGADPRLAWLLCPAASAAQARADVRDHRAEPPSDGHDASICVRRHGHPGCGQPHLVVFFATWLPEPSYLAAQLAGLDSYAPMRAARHGHLPRSRPWARRSRA
jgi:hypothetical protein